MIPNQGRICVGGHDLRSLDLEFLRANVASVMQDVFLFHGTVHQNIAFGRPDATVEQIVQAAQAANAHEFIVDLTDGYNTVIGERGVRLSGGQKQRISIARALLKDAPILTPGRGHLLGRHRDRVADPAGAKPPHPQPHHARDRPPPLNHPPRRQNRRAG